MAQSAPGKNVFSKALLKRDSPSNSPVHYGQYRFANARMALAIIRPRLRKSKYRVPRPLSQGGNPNA